MASSRSACRACSSACSAVTVMKVRKVGFRSAKEIRERDRTPVKRSAVLAHGELTVRLPRLFQRLFGGDGNEGAQGGVEPVDAGNGGGGQVHGGKAART